MIFVRMTLAGLALWLSNSAVFAGCVDASESCQIETGSYEILLPDGFTKGGPAMMFIHGYGSSGNGSLKMRGMVNEALGRGYAVIAPNGLPRTNGNGNTWSFHPERPERRDEISFLTDVRDDAANRFGIDPASVLLAGFSIGGSMVAYTACTAPGAFAAYAPVGGNFWRPHPERCSGEVRMLHTHGWRDMTVPLEGRVLRGEDAEDPHALVQGDVFHALEIWRAANECNNLRATAFETDGAFWRRKWERCKPGSALELALFPGGHAIPRGWAKMALDWFEALPR